MILIERVDTFSSYESLDDQVLFEIVEQTNKGIGYPFFIRLTSKMPFSLAQWASFLRISKRTMERIRDKTHYIEAPYSEQVIRIAMVYRYGISVFGNRMKLNEWLSLHSIPLGDKPPIDFFNNSFGIEIVKNELGRIQFGILL